MALHETVAATLSRVALHWATMHRCHGGRKDVCLGRNQNLSGTVCYQPLPANPLEVAQMLDSSSSKCTFQTPSVSHSEKDLLLLLKAVYDASNRMPLNLVSKECEVNCYAVNTIMQGIASLMHCIHRISLVAIDSTEAQWYVHIYIYVHAYSIA